MSHERNLKRFQTIGYFSAFIGLGMSTAVLGPALPFLSENTSTQIGEVSILFTTSAAGYLVGSILGGRLIDRFSGHMVAGAALIGIGVSLALTPILSMLPLLGGVMLLLGVVQAVTDVGGNAMLVWVHGRDVGPYMNALHLFFGVGTFLAPIILAQSVLHSSSISPGFWVIAILMIIPSIFMLKVPSPTSIGRDSELGGRTNVGVLTLAVIILFFYVGAEVGFGGWLYTYALEVGLANETSAAYMTSAFWGAFTIGRLLSIPIAAKIRPRWILFGDLAGGVISLFLILFFTQSDEALWIGTVLLGLSLASVFPTILSMAERRMTLTGKVTSWFFVGASTGGMFFPWLMGQIFEGIKPSAILFVLLGNLIAAFIFYLILMLVSGSSPDTEGSTVS